MFSGVTYNENTSIIIYIVMALHERWTWRTRNITYNVIGFDSHGGPCSNFSASPHADTKLSAQNMEYKSYKKSETFIIATCLEMHAFIRDLRRDIKISDRIMDVMYVISIYKTRFLSNICMMALLQLFKIYVHVMWGWRADAWIAIGRFVRRLRQII